MHTEMFLIRHGETVWNAESRFQGHQDSPLTPRGIAQAEAAAEYLRSHMLAALYSSDLPRTLQTADPIARATRLAIVPEPALRERERGPQVQLLHAQKGQEAQLHNQLVEIETSPRIGASTDSHHV